MADKLKTLKDIEFPNMLWTQDNPKGLNGEKEMRDVLKQEAITWVKHGLKQLQDEDDMDKRLTIRGGVNAFKNFFNITEEDLK